MFKGSIKGQEIIKLSNGNMYKVKEVLAYSKQYDYIIFKVEGNNFNYIPVTKRGYEIGDEVYAIGSPKGLKIHYQMDLYHRNIPIILFKLVYL